MSKTKPPTKAELQKLLHGATGALASSITTTVRELTETMRAARRYPHCQYEIWPLKKMVAFHIGVLRGINPELRRAVIAACKQDMRDWREMRARIEADPRDWKEAA